MSIPYIPVTGGGVGQVSDESIETLARARMSENLGLSVGSFLLGFVVDLMLFGFMTHQVVVWLSSSATDRKMNRVIVLWLIAFSTGTTIYGLNYMWDLFVTGFGTFRNFIEIDKLGLYAVITSLTINPVQVFYLERAYRLNHRRIWIPILIGPVILTAVAAAIATCVVTNRHLSILERALVVERNKVVFLLGTTANVVVDLSLMCLIIYGLLYCQTGFTETDRLVKRLIVISFEAQVPCMMVALGFLFTFIIAGTSSRLNFFWMIAQPKFYVCSFLAVLNHRTVLQKEMGTSGASSSGVRGVSYRARTSQRGQDSMELSKIHVNTQVHEESHRSASPIVGLSRFGKFVGDEDVLVGFESNGDLSTRYGNRV